MPTPPPVQPAAVVAVPDVTDAKAATDAASAEAALTVVAPDATKAQAPVDGPAAGKDTKTADVKKGDGKPVNEGFLLKAETPQGEAKTVDAKPEMAKDIAAAAQTDAPKTTHHADAAATPAADATLAAVTVDAATPQVAPQPTQPLTPPPAATAAAAAQAAAQTASQAQAPVPVAGVAFAITSKALSGKSSFDIRLDPAELGRIEVHLDVNKHGEVSSRLVVDRPETLDLLKRDAANLTRALNDAGLKTSDNGMQFTLRDQNSGQQQQQNGSRTARLTVDDTSLSGVDAMPQTYGRLYGATSGLDIRV